jgi:tRNA-2-methylthio-N6-dimethylallyladenosine synthase
MEVVEEARFDQAFMFIFSPRPGTAAAAMSSDFVPEEVIQQRFNRLVEAQNRISGELNREMVGTRVEVLSEGPSKKDPAVATTRTRTGRVVHVPGDHRPGVFLDARIDRAAMHHLMGTPV